MLFRNPLTVVPYGDAMFLEIRAALARNATERTCAMGRKS